MSQSKGAYINPKLWNHTHTLKRQVEVALNHDGNITGIKLLSPGEYYFDPNFGLEDWDRTIFDWNYTYDPSTPAHSINTGNYVSF